LGLDYLQARGPIDWGKVLTLTSLLKIAPDVQSAARGLKPAPTGCGMTLVLLMIVDTIDNSKPNDQGGQHPLLAMDDALKEYILFLEAHKGAIKDLPTLRAFEQHALKMLESFEVLKRYTVRRIVADNSLPTPSLN
jgi:hypothetical protein